MLSWNEAKQFCAGRNSTLPIITNEDIDSVFQQFIVNDEDHVIQNNDVWIDAHARPVNNSVSWHWIDGRPSGNDNTVVKKSLDLLRRLLYCFVHMFGVHFRVAEFRTTMNFDCIGSRSHQRRYFMKQTFSYQLSRIEIYCL